MQILTHDSYERLVNLLNNEVKLPVVANIYKTVKAEGEWWEIPTKHTHLSQ